MALLVVKYYTSRLRQIQDICNLRFVFFEFFFDAEYNEAEITCTKKFLSRSCQNPRPSLDRPQNFLSRSGLNPRPSAWQTSKNPN